MDEIEAINHLKHMHDGVSKLPYDCELNKDIEAVKVVLNYIKELEDENYKQSEFMKDQAIKLRELMKQIKE